MLILIGKTDMNKSFVKDNHLYIIKFVSVLVIIHQPPSLHLDTAVYWMSEDLLWVSFETPFDLYRDIDPCMTLIIFIIISCRAIVAPIEGPCRLLP